MAEDRAVSVDDEPDYLREYEHLDSDPDSYSPSTGPIIRCLVFDRLHSAGCGGWATAACERS